jgi:ATP-binding cassette subfamily C protein PrsD
VYSRFIRRYRSPLWVAAICSVLLNVLTFAGSIYMMLVYDSVLPSRSLPTLAGLFVMLLLVYLFQALFDAIRAEAMLSVANGVRGDLAHAVHHATVSRALRAGRVEGDGMQPLRDLDQIHAFLASPGPLAMFDVPWVIMFLIVLAALHWALGLAALIGAIILAVIATFSARASRSGTMELTRVTGQRSAAVLAQIRAAEPARAMAMQDRLIGRSLAWDGEFTRVQSSLSRTVARFGGASRTFRIFLQSIILTVGALLVIDGQATGGVILASSVLSGRALAPVDQAIANWRGFASARAGWARLVEAISVHHRPPPRSVTLAPPAGEITARDLWIAPPGSPTPVLGNVNFTLKPGDALAVIGPSASGKTSLAKAMLGIWPPTRGEIRLDGATHDQWDPAALGASFGYVPQSVELLDGTLGENIARFDTEASSDAIIAAATTAGLHGLILSMPDGYDTRVTAGGVELSAGQRQRLGLARALYGDPFLIVLDEANSNLDAAGDAALATAIEQVRARKGIVVMITHRPAALGPMSHIAVLRGGRLADFGERDEVLARLQQGEQKPPLQQPTAAPVREKPDQRASAGAAL